MVKQQMITVVVQFLYLLTDLLLLLVLNEMMVLVRMLDMLEYMNGLIVLGHKKVLILMEKQVEIKLVFLFLYLQPLL